MFRKMILLLLLIPVSLYSQNLDIDLLRQINTSEVLPSDPFFQFTSDSYTAIVIAVPLSVGIAGLIRQDEDMCMKAIEIGVSSAVNAGFAHLLKYAVNRPRPYVTYPDIMKKSDGGSGSFPSGHTSAAFATATSLSLSYPKWYVIIPSYLWAGTVGYSRMYLGVHYPSDVLAGAVLGAGSAWLTYKVNNWLQTSFKKNYGFHF